jgi:hypothetical protein
MYEKHMHKKPTQGLSREKMYDAMVAARMPQAEVQASVAPVTRLMESTIKSMFPTKTASGELAFVFHYAHKNEDLSLRKEVASFLKNHSKYLLLKLWYIGLVVTDGCMYLGASPDALCLLWDTTNESLVWVVIELKSAMKNASEQDWAQFVRNWTRKGVFKSGVPFHEEDADVRDPNSLWAQLSILYRYQTRTGNGVQGAGPLSTGGAW